MLIQKVLKLKGHDSKFVMLGSNVDHMWYEEGQRVIAVMQEQLLTPPDSGPKLCIDQYLGFLDQTDEACGFKMGSAAPTSDSCQLCHQNVDLQCMHTCIGRHILLGECGADVCGYCGGHQSTAELFRKTPSRLMSLIIMNCPLDCSNVHYLICNGMYVCTKLVHREEEVGGRGRGAR